MMAGGDVGFWQRGDVSGPSRAVVVAQWSRPRQTGRGEEFLRKRGRGRGRGCGC